MLIRAHRFATRLLVLAWSDADSLAPFLVTAPMAVAGAALADGPVRCCDGHLRAAGNAIYGYATRDAGGEGGPSSCS